tara:strand:+ start:7582 stop:8529 length:948 start_codon:yes stop_codon:yes gene_type:complete
MLFDTRESGVTGNFQFLMTQRSSSTGKQRFLYYNTNGYKLMSGYDYPTAAWYHIVFSKSGTSTTWYVNGSAVSTFTDVNDASNDQFRIGASKTISNDYSGQIDEFAIFDKALSASEVTTAYNEGITGDLTSLSPVVWWRMGDGTQPAADGTNNLVFDQADKTLGSEVLTGFTNGSTYPFDTFASSGTSITSAIETSGNWGGCASNSFSITSGEIYKVTFNLTYNSGADTLRVVFADSANGAATQRCAPYYTDTNGVNTVYVKATATDSTAHLQLGTWHSSDSINFSASNVSVKPVNGTTLELFNNTAISDSNVPS